MQQSYQKSLDTMVHRASTKLLAIALPDHK